MVAKLDSGLERSMTKKRGFPDHAFDGRPVIGICNTWSEPTPCNSDLRDLAQSVKRGAWVPEPPLYERGYAKLHIDHVLQAGRGAELDFLVGKDTRLVTRESH